MTIANSQTHKAAVLEGDAIVGVVSLVNPAKFSAAVAVIIAVPAFVVDVVAAVPRPKYCLRRQRNRHALPVMRALEIAR